MNQMMQRMVQHKKSRCDIVLFNWQPSLHRVSIRSHRVKVVSHCIFRFNHICCNFVHADFEGNEMNNHSPMMMDVAHNFVVHKAADTLVVPLKDIIMSTYQLKRKGGFKTPHYACRVRAQLIPLEV